MGGMGMGMMGVSDQPLAGGGHSGPGANPPSPQPASRGIGGGRAGGGGGMSAKQSREADFSFTVDDLIEVIKTSISPTSGDDTGGVGSISPAAGTLVINQTRAVHEKIEKLLDDLRASTPGLRVVSIRATWLLLDLKQLNQLLGSKPGKEGGIDRKALEEMAAKSKGYLGAITCFSGQTVHIASGRSRSAVVGAIPVVGGPVGYHPFIRNPQSGAVLQVTPQLLPNAQAALLDVCSSVTRLEAPHETIRFLAGESTDPEKDGKGKSSTTITLDRVNMVVGQLATTLKVPLGEPTLVGGLTREQSADSPEEAAAVPQLYLFIEATAK
jgi:hypothetical protein